MIYAIQAGSDGPIKFGVAKNPVARMRELQTGNQSRLELLAVMGLPNEFERKLHAYLRAHRLVGEWFSNCGKVREVLSDPAWQFNECVDRCKYG